jgi:type I restriction enzyme M protein
MSSLREEGGEKDLPGPECAPWRVADKLCGSADISEYEAFVLRLIFLKYVTDAFKESHETLAEEKVTCERADGHLESPGWGAAAGTYLVPPGARWDYLRELAKHPQIGTMIDNAIDSISVHNPSLGGTLPKTHSMSRLEPTLRGELIDLISGMLP